jgi:AcrR family transcriptional regulator
LQDIEIREEVSSVAAMIAALSVRSGRVAVDARKPLLRIASRQEPLPLAAVAIPPFTEESTSDFGLRRKQALSRQLIVAAGLELVQEGGLDAVSLRRVAGSLGAAPASLYVYVANREELYELMLDHVLLQVPAVEVTVDRWREQLLELFRAMLAALDRHPGIGQVGLGSLPVARGELAIAENALGLLRAGGVADQAAAWTCDALLLFTFANAVEYAVEAQRPPIAAQHKSPRMDYGAVRDTYRRLPVYRYPNLNELAVQMTTGGDPERFEFGISALVRGAIER